MLSSLLVIRNIPNVLASHEKMMLIRTSGSSKNLDAMSLGQWSSCISCNHAQCEVFDDDMYSVSVYFRQHAQNAGGTAGQHAYTTFITYIQQIFIQTNITSS